MQKDQEVPSHENQENRPPCDHVRGLVGRPACEIVLLAASRLDSEAASYLREALSRHVEIGRLARRVSAARISVQVTRSLVYPGCGSDRPNVDALEQVQRQHRSSVADRDRYEALACEASLEALNIRVVHGLSCLFDHDHDRIWICPMCRGRFATCG